MFEGAKEAPKMKKTTQNVLPRHMSEAERRAAAAKRHTARKKATSDEEMAAVERYYRTLLGRPIGRPLCKDKE